MARLTETPARSRLGAFVNLMFGYDGRIGRLYFFLGFLAFVAIIGFLSGMAEDATAGTGDIGRYVAFVFIVGSGIWMHSAVVIKRLHDRDKGAGWYLIYGAAPFGFFMLAIYFWTVRVVRDRLDPVRALLRGPDLGDRRARLPARHPRAEPLRSRALDPALVRLDHSHRAAPCRNIGLGTTRRCNSRTTAPSYSICSLRAC